MSEVESLLLINGYAATGSDWDPTFLAELGRSFEVICPDNRGVGGSELGDAELSVESMASDMEALLDSLGIETALVVGWSMGGFVAQRLAARAPHRVSALALLATDAGGPEAVAADPAVWALLCDHSGTPREQASRLIALLFPAPLSAEIDRELGEVVAAARAGLSDRTLLAQEAAMEAWHQKPQPPFDLAVPVVVLHGDLDQVIPVGNAELLGGQLPAARVEVLEGCGHALMAQEPARVAAAIRGLVF
ncbi:MAG TPA: alpha/beta hydrolase [Solirubrobacterales bacterium]|nr:alpha/beta hydrolase [Solirubrobacterales bacterium]